MKTTAKSVSKLNEINLNFYKTAGKYWNESLLYFWQGFLRVGKYFENQDKILDIGCGNGRFYFFLLHHFSHLDLDYLGIDKFWILEDELKENFVDTITKINLQELPKIKLNLENIELSGKINPDLGWKNIPKSPKNYYFNQTGKKNQNQHLIKFLDLDITKLENFQKLQKYTKICLFGVIHHIPSFDLRAKIFENIYNSLEKNGILIFTTWQFLEIPRLQKHVLTAEEVKNLDFAGDLESGDYLLTWTKKVESLRYSHFFDDAEIGKLLKNKFEILETFHSDGAEKRNKYYICRRV
jgi:SAM-dependent methyltransferase